MDLMAPAKVHCQNSLERELIMNMQNVLFRHCQNKTEVQEIRIKGGRNTNPSPAITDE